MKYVVPVMKRRGGGVLVFNSSMAAHMPASIMAAPIPICVAPAVFDTKLVHDVVKRPTVMAMGITTTSAWAGLNPVFKGKAGDPMLVAALVTSLQLARLPRRAVSARTLARSLRGGAGPARQSQAAAASADAGRRSG